MREGGIRGGVIREVRKKKTGKDKEGKANGGIVTAGAGK